MKVSIELQPCLKNKSGIGVYTYELTKRLQNFRDIKFEGNIFNFFNRNHIEKDIHRLNIKKIYVHYFLMEFIEESGVMLL